MSRYLFPAVAVTGFLYRITTAEGDVVLDGQQPVSGRLPQFEGPTDVSTLLRQELDWKREPVGDPVEITGVPDEPAVAAPGTSGQVGLGHFADSANYTDLAVALPFGGPYTLVAADLNAGDTTLTPASANAFELPADGRVPLPAGTYVISTYADVSFETAPTVDMQISTGPYFRLAPPSVLTAIAAEDAAEKFSVPTSTNNDFGFFHNVNGDGVATDQDSEVSNLIVVIIGDTVTVEFLASLGNNGPAADDPGASLYNAELIIQRIA